MNCYKFLSFEKFCYIYNFKFVTKNISSKIDKIFILTLDTSYERHKHIYQEIIKNDLFNSIIVINTPYTKCKKLSYVKSPLKDILDANLQIYKYCLSKSINNILLLEDDFYFEVKPNFNKISKILDELKPDIFYLGHLPFLS